MLYLLSFQQRNGFKCFASDCYIFLFVSIATGLPYFCLIFKRMIAHTIYVCTLQCVDSYVRHCLTRIHGYFHTNKKSHIHSTDSSISTSSGLLAKFIHIYAAQLLISEMSVTVPRFSTALNSITWL